MILVDSIVLMDYLLDLDTPKTRFLHRSLGRETFATGDLMRAEVLQGTRSEREWREADEFTSGLVPVTISDWPCAFLAAQNYKALRSLGITPRKTIDTLIATRCILDNIPLLTSDRDFDAFGEHLGLVLV
jgi:predicted nucleic acid-binding protein